MRCATCQRPLEVRFLRVGRPAVLALFVLTVLASYRIFGVAFHRLIEGMERPSMVGPALALPVVLLLATVIAATFRWRGPVCASCGPARAWLVSALPVEHAARVAALPTRRRVLRQALGLLGATVAASAGAFGAVLFRNRGWIRVGQNIGGHVETVAPVPDPAWQGSRVRNYRRLGRTGVQVSDISLGSSNLKSLEVARLALERGVTYFDTAPDYAHHRSEQLLGEALQGHREHVFLASKFCTADGHLPLETPVPRIIEAVEGSLRRLRTDRIDLLHIHSCDRPERLLAPNFHEAFDRLKEQGKARFLGMSSHTPNLAAVANTAIDSGRFDVLMLAYHHGMGWGLEQIIERAAAKDIAVVAMKTLKGAKHEKLDAFRDDGRSYTQAAFRWVLSNPAVSCLVISFSEPAHVDEYLNASGTQLTSADRRVLTRYDELIAGTYCHPHCGACLSTCVASLPIDDVLRYRMYAEDYGMPEQAQRKYARLDGGDAAQCIGCPAPCAGACPYGVAIQDSMLAAHATLTTLA